MTLTKSKMTAKQKLRMTDSYLQTLGDSLREAVLLVGVYQGVYGHLPSSLLEAVSQELQGMPPVGLINTMADAKMITQRLLRENEARAKAMEEHQAVLDAVGVPARSPDMYTPDAED